MNGDWAQACVAELHDALLDLDVHQLGDWIRVHVVDEDLWAEYAVLLTSMAAVWMIDDVARRFGPMASRIDGFIPEMDADTEVNPRNAALAVTMAMNDDSAGVCGIVEGARSADQLPDLCGYLAIIASRALNRQIISMRVERLP